MAKGNREREQAITYLTRFMKHGKVQHILNKSLQIYQRKIGSEEGGFTLVEQLYCDSSSRRCPKKEIPEAEDINYVKHQSVRYLSAFKRVDSENLRKVKSKWLPEGKMLEFNCKNRNQKFSRILQSNVFNRKGLSRYTFEIRTLRTQRPPPPISFQSVDFRRNSTFNNIFGEMRLYENASFLFCFQTRKY